MPCHNIDGAHQHGDVNIGWFPFKVTRPTVILSKPGAGTILRTITAGKGIGVQSARNPDCKPNPPQRRAVVGADGRHYYWCYAREGAKTGWIEVDHVAFDRDLNKPPLSGPAGEDFEVGRTKPTRGRGPGCGKLSQSKPTRIVDATTLHFRYSPRGTSKHYLHRGDRVRVLIANSPHGFHLVQVLKAASDGSVRAGMRGWVLAEELKTP